MRILNNKIFNRRVEKLFNYTSLTIDGGFMFSNKLTCLVLLVFALLIFGCSENPTIVNDNQRQMPTSIDYPCGAQFYDVYVDRTTLGGIVTLSNDLDNLYISYFLNSPYLAEPGEMHVWLGTTAPTKRGVPKLYLFHSTNSDYVSTYSFTLPLSDIQQYMVGGTFYFMTYFSAVIPRNGGGYYPANDGYSVEIVKTKAKGNWYGFNSYTLKECGINNN